MGRTLTTSNARFICRICDANTCVPTSVQGADAIGVGVLPGGPEHHGVGPELREQRHEPTVAHGGLQHQQRVAAGAVEPLDGVAHRCVVHGGAVGVHDLERELFQPVLTRRRDAAKLSIVFDHKRESDPRQSDRAEDARSSGRTSRHAVRDGVERRILSGRLRGGDRLRQTELAREFGVSQSVVRESLIELQFGGLVEAVDHLGVFVKPIDPAVLLSAYEIREVFEGLAARRCCEHASRRDIRELRELAAEIHRMGRRGRREEMGSLDRRFHRQTIRISGNPLLDRLTEGYRMLGMVVRAHRKIDAVRDEHVAILDAIESADADAAEDRARAHVRAARDALEAEVASGGFEPAWVEPDAP